MPRHLQGQPVRAGVEIQAGAVRLEAHCQIPQVLQPEAAAFRPELGVFHRQGKLRLLPGVGKVGHGLHPVVGGAHIGGKGKGGIQVYHPFRRNGAPALVEPGDVFPLLQTVQAAADHVDPLVQGAVGGVHVHHDGGAPGQPRPVVIQGPGEVIFRGDIGEVPVILPAEEGKVPLRDIPFLPCVGDGLPESVGAEPFHRGADALRSFGEAIRPPGLRDPVLLQGKGQRQIEVPLPALVFFQGAEAQKEGIFPRLQGPEIVGPVQTPGEALPGGAEIAPVLHIPDGPHPFPAPVAAPVEEGPGADARIGPGGLVCQDIQVHLLPVLQGEDAAVGVRLQDAPAHPGFRLRQLGGAVPVHQQDIARAAPAPLVRLFPMGVQHVGIYPGIGGEAAVPELHRGPAQGGEDAEAHAVRLPGGEGEEHVSLRPEDGTAPVQPVDLFIGIPVALGPAGYPAPGDIAPGIGGDDMGGEGSLSAGIGEGRGGFRGDARVPEGFIVRQEPRPGVIPQGPPEGTVPPDVPVPPKVEAQGGAAACPDPGLPDQGDDGKALLRDRLRLFGFRLRQDPGIGEKKPAKGFLSAFRFQLVVPDQETVPGFLPGQLREPGFPGEPGPDPILPHLGGNGPVHQGEQRLRLPAGTGCGQTVPPSVQGNVALRRGGGGAVRRPHAGDAVGPRQEVLQELGLGSGDPPPAQGQGAPVLQGEEGGHPPGDAVRSGGDRLRTLIGKGEGGVVFPDDAVRPLRLRLQGLPAAAACEQDQGQDQNEKQRFFHGSPPFRGHLTI